MIDPRLLRDLLKMGDAVIWCGRCHGVAESLLDDLAQEIVAARYEPGLLFVRALKGMERHHSDLAMASRWALVARALEGLIREDLVRATPLEAGKTSHQNANPVRP